MRRLSWVVLLAGVACNEVSKVEPGPTDAFYRPAGLGVYAGKLIVASTNSDLRYDPATGGSVITVDPGQPGRTGDPAYPRWSGGVNVESFASDLAIADATARPGRDEVCPVASPLALLAVRGADVLYELGLDPATGAPSCASAGCTLPLATTGTFADAYAVGVACASAPSPMARAYVGYLRGAGGAAWMTEVDLLTGTVRSNSFGAGQMRSFAFDAARKRLFAAQAGQGIRWIDLAGGCQFDLAEIDGGCHAGGVALPGSLDPRAIALSRPDAPGNRRLYVLARVVDSQAAAAWGVRAGEVDGVLLVTELVDDLYGGVTVQLVRPPISVGYGPTALTVLPGRAGTARRDVVAAITTDDALLLLYDDDADARVYLSRDVSSAAATGHPWLGTQLYGLAVDPVPAADGDNGGLMSATLYVGSYEESFVSRINVPVDDIERTRLPPAASLRRIYGGR